MPISIYLSARREAPLEPDEQAIVDAWRAAANADHPDGQWAFSFFRSRVPSRVAPPVVLQGSAELPLTDDWPLVERMVARWCECFASLRAEIRGAVWSASIDDRELVWDDAARKYAPPAAFDRDSYARSVAFVRGH